MQTLPPEAIAVLGLPFQYEVPANLANNSNVFLKVYTATILTPYNLSIGAVYLRSARSISCL